MTDLMTSLMVIFILLLLVFVQRTGAKDTAEATRLLAELEKQMKPGGQGQLTITQDKQEPNKILLIAPERLMSFESSKSALSDEGKRFLQEKLPVIANILYDGRFRNNIESIVVEGHSDLQSFQGRPADESRNKNLELSQQRAMEVVKTALIDLKTTPGAEQDWFIHELSSSGRGQQDCQAADIQDQCRKVIFVNPCASFISEGYRGPDEMTSVLEALRLLKAEPELIRRSPLSSVIDASRECRRLIETRDTLRTQAGTVRFPPPPLDPKNVWRQFEAAGADLSKLNSLEFRTLCSADEFATEPRFVQALRAQPERLRRKVCLYCMVNSYFNRWRSMESPEELEQVLVNAIDRYSRPSPVIARWRAARSLFSSRAAEGLAGFVVDRQSDFEAVLKLQYVGACHSPRAFDSS